VDKVITEVAVLGQRFDMQLLKSVWRAVQSIIFPAWYRTLSLYGRVV